jgi:hypothetical protein
VQRDQPPARRCQLGGLLRGRNRVQLVQVQRRKSGLPASVLLGRVVRWTSVSKAFETGIAFPPGDPALKAAPLEVVKGLLVMHGRR